MRSHRMTTAVLLSMLAVICVSAQADPVPPRDLPGSHDSPIVSRFAGSVIVGYQTVDFDEVTWPLGKYDSGAHKFARSKTSSGRITRIAYAVPRGKSALEVFRNYQAALAQADFDMQFQCDRLACGRDTNAFTKRLLTSEMMDSLAGHADASYYNLLPTSLQAIQDDLHYLTARLTRPQGNVALSLMVVGNADDPVGVLLQTVEEKPMATGEVTVNAKAMNEGLAQHGHIALYGIHFATDSASLKPESDATLAQMVALLTSQPTLKVYIVGHTDNTGTLQHNLALSQHRADSVAKALEAHGIAASRLTAKGVASFVPVASNDTEASRAKNRRVELVRQ